MNRKYTLVSVIIVNYNGKVYLDDCITSLIEQTYPAIEIVLVDNGSNDDSIDHVKKKYPFVKIIDNKENLGFVKGVNIGINHARGEFIATLNNDTRVVPGWVEELVVAINSGKNIGMCASKMLFMKYPELINSTGICISRSGACWDRGMFERDKGQYDIITEVFGPCAGAAMYRKNMLEEIGLFDDDFYAYMEDADLAFRGRLAGWKCLYVPKAVVYHVHGGTAGYGSDYTVYYGNRNIIWNTIKNYPAKLLIFSLPWIIGRNFAVIPYYLLKGYGVTILQSKIDALKGISKMITKRTPCLVNPAEINKHVQTWADICSPPDNHINKIK